ncbi:MAG: DUF5992 family protein [Psychrosphaera sp.]|nr:DUF5992 family protein [Psychrosphaera sp.]
MNKKILILAALLLSPSAFADGAWIATGTKVVSITPRNGDIDMFVVQTSGGAGLCAGQKIYFRKGDALVDNGSDAAYKRVYSTILLAFTSGLKIDIHNPISGDSQTTACIYAVDIKLVK